MAERSMDPERFKGFAMDGEFVKDLLECPVCLDQLTSDSRVLPCQHTFCESCLEGCYKAKDKLDCPVCRAPSNVPIKYLPRNMLLLRFLEGFKTKKVRDIDEVFPPRKTVSGTMRVHLFKMKKDPQYKAIIGRSNGYKVISDFSASASTSGNRIPVPEKPSSSCISFKNTQPLNKDTVAKENYMRLCAAVKDYKDSLPPEPSSASLVECPSKNYMSKFRTRNMPILHKILRSLYYPASYSYTASKKDNKS